MKIDDIVEGNVSMIFKTYAIINLGNKWQGIVHVSKMSDYYISKITSIFELGKKYFFKIQAINIQDKKVELSWKDIMPRFLKDPFDYQIYETKNGFHFLKKFLEKEVKID